MASRGSPMASVPHVPNQTDAKADQRPPLLTRRTRGRHRKTKCRRADAIALVAESWPPSRSWKTRGRLVVLVHLPVLHGGGGQDPGRGDEGLVGVGPELARPPATAPVIGDVRLVVRAIDQDCASAGPQQANTVGGPVRAVLSATDLPATVTCLLMISQMLMMNTSMDIARWRQWS